MNTAGIIGLELRKIVDLNAGEFISLLEQRLIPSIEAAVRKTIPQHDPEEDIVWTTDQACEFLGIERRTYYKKVALGQIEATPGGSRTTKAACRRYLKLSGISLRKARVENPVRKKQNRGRKR